MKRLQIRAFPLLFSVALLLGAAACDNPDAGPGNGGSGGISNGYGMGGSNSQSASSGIMSTHGSVGVGGSSTGSDNPCHCIMGYGNPSMNYADIDTLIDVGLKTCFPWGLDDDGYALEAAAACLPVTVGTATNGLAVQVKYFCSDVCPHAGGLYVVYKGIPKESCCNVGGEPFIDPAWLGYIGCSAQVYSSTCP